jgi:hypothetical protein
MKIIGWRPASCGLEELCMGTACDFGWLGLFISRWKTVGLQGLSRGGTHACAGPSGPPGTLGRGGSQVASAEDEKSLTVTGLAGPAVGAQTPYINPQCKQAAGEREEGYAHTREHHAPAVLCLLAA